MASLLDSCRSRRPRSIQLHVQPDGAGTSLPAPTAPWLGDGEAVGTVVEKRDRAFSRITSRLCRGKPELLLQLSRDKRL